MICCGTNTSRSFMASRLVNKTMELYFGVVIIVFIDFRGTESIFIDFRDLSLTSIDSQFLLLFSIYLYGSSSLQGGAGRP